MSGVSKEAIVPLSEWMTPTRTRPSVGTDAGTSLLVAAEVVAGAMGSGTGVVAGPSGAGAGGSGARGLAPHARQAGSNRGTSEMKLRNPLRFMAPELRT
jgi:hypothetical protein